MPRRRCREQSQRKAQFLFWALASPYPDHSGHQLRLWVLNLRRATRSRSSCSDFVATVLATRRRICRDIASNSSADCRTSLGGKRRARCRDCNPDLSTSCHLPRAIFEGEYLHGCMACETLRIAVEQACLWLPNVTFFDLPAAQRAVRIRARDLVVDDNKPSSDAERSSRVRKSWIGTHLDLHST